MLGPFVLIIIAREIHSAVEVEDHLVTDASGTLEFLRRVGHIGLDSTVDVARQYNNRTVLGCDCAPTWDIECNGVNTQVHGCEMSTACDGRGGASAIAAGASWCMLSEERREYIIYRVCTLVLLFLFLLFFHAPSPTPPSCACVLCVCACACV